jgi:hypothetical protein
MGHAIGAFISATTKAGSNDLHGSGYWQMQQFRWNATPHYTRLIKLEIDRKGRAGTGFRKGQHARFRGGRPGLHSQDLQRQEPFLLFHFV